MSQSELEAEFERLCRIYGIGGYVREYRFCLPRRFAFDFAWMDAGVNAGVAVECEGGVWTQGAHGRGWGVSRDIEKGNLAALLGWCVLRCTSTMLRDNPDKFMRQVMAALREHGALEEGSDERGNG